MNSLRQLVYGNKLTLKQQVDLADDLLDTYVTMINDLLPDVDLWTSGSVLYNSFSAGCGEGVKLELLHRKQIRENIEQCSGCGREHDKSTMKWILERWIQNGKKRLKDENH